MEWKKGVRTDLAVEALELGEETDGAALPGMRHRAFERLGFLSLRWRFWTMTPPSGWANPLDTT